MLFKIHPDGTIQGMYRDSLVPVAAKCGQMKVERATHLEYDNATQEWVATHAKTGKEICRHKFREEAVKLEISFMEKEIAAGRA